MDWRSGTWFGHHRLQSSQHRSRARTSDGVHDIDTQECISPFSLTFVSPRYVSRHTDGDSLPVSQRIGRFFPPQAFPRDLANLGLVFSHPLPQTFFPDFQQPTPTPPFAPSARQTLLRIVCLGHPYACIPSACWLGRNRGGCLSSGEGCPYPRMDVLARQVRRSQMQYSGLNIESCKHEPH